MINFNLIWGGMKARLQRLIEEQLDSSLERITWLGRRQVVDTRDPQYTYESEMDSYTQVRIEGESESEGEGEGESDALITYSTCSLAESHDGYDCHSFEEFWKEWSDWWDLLYYEKKTLSLHLEGDEAARDWTVLVIKPRIGLEEHERFYCPW